MNFYNIFPYSPGEEELLAQEAIEYVERTGNEIILYCMTLHPQNFPAAVLMNIRVLIGAILCMFFIYNMLVGKLFSLFVFPLDKLDYR
jgi:hypothetical protein